MKKKISQILIPVLALSLLSACGQTKKEASMQSEQESTAAVVSESIEPSAETPEFNLTEENTADDSYTYEWSYGEGPEQDPFRYFKKVVAPQYVDTWVENGEILDLELDGLCGQGHTYLQGWILFTGSLKQETGWNPVTFQGKTAYCRSVHITGPEEGTFTAVKSQAAIPIPYLREDIFRKKFQDLDFVTAMNQPIILPELEEAQFYCHENGGFYRLTDFGTLSELSRALKPNLSYGPYINTAMPWDAQEKQHNYLILTFRDGTRVQLLCAGDGANLVNGWLIGEMLKLPRSLYEMFSVPLEAPGYEVQEDGTTQVQAASTDYDYVGSEIKEIAWEQVLTFSPEGNLLKKDLKKSAAGEILRHEVCTIAYTPDGNIQQITIFEGGQEMVREDYQWNESGTLGMLTESFPDGTALDTRYEYDDQNRLIAVIRYNAEGQELSPTSQYYFWYDEDGIQYGYEYGPDGSVVSGTPPETPVRREK